ncbi:MAG: sirohydrochlorin nickelochelatase [Methanomassiliicoccales archaeon]
MKREGILVIGHGSKLEYNKNAINHFATRLAERFKDFPIAVGFMNINEPTIKDGLGKLVADGAETIYVVPCFLAHGIHTRDDITSELGIPQGGKGGTTNINGKRIEIRYCEPIGVDERIVDILEERVKERMRKD